MKYLPLAMAVACLVGALTVINVAPAQAEFTFATNDVSKATPAATAVGRAEIRTADPAKTPG